MFAGNNHNYEDSTMKMMSYVFRLFVFCGIIALAAPLVSVAASNDSAINKAVEDTLMKGGTNFDATDVIVNTKDGVVSLRGDVKTAKEAMAIKNAAEAVPGVKQVHSTIDVKDNIGGSSK